MKVLVGCEFSQVVTKAFRTRGHEAYSCDVLPTEGNSDWHIQGDVRDVLSDGWDLAVFHPPCTYLTCTGNRWNLPEYKERFPKRSEQKLEAVEFFLEIANAPIDRLAIENPIGIMSSQYREPDQIIQPYEFGSRVKKSTCLWLKNLPILKPTKIVSPELHVCKNGSKMAQWYIDTMKIRDLKERSKARSKTFQGIADAMASQWGRCEKYPIQSSLDNFTMGSGGLKSC